jgi:hypothetical protein
LSGLLSGIGHILRAGLIAWGALAIFYSNLPWPVLRLVLALTFAAFGIWALWFAREVGGWLWFAALFGGVLLWWLLIPPSHDRMWRPEVARMPRVTVDGDRVRIRDVRNFDYRSVDDFTPRYEEREVSLSHLTGVDFYVSYWMPGPIGHTFVSFVFDNAPPLSISIEARPEAGEGYSPIASLFKQFELIYVVGDERDIVRVRTNYRNEEVYLYHVVSDRESVRQLFQVYLARINELADRSEFYHLLSNSCTVNIVRYAQAVAGGGRFDIRHYLNGLFDAYLYDLRALDTTLPFEELRSRSRINEAAVAAGDAADFPERIRKVLPSGRT